MPLAPQGTEIDLLWSISVPHSSNDENFWVTGGSEEWGQTQGRFVPQEALMVQITLISIMNEMYGA